MSAPSHSIGTLDTKRARLKPAAGGRGGWGYREIATAILQHYDPRQRASTSTFRVLEAGGGSNSWLPMPTATEITTIDISPEQLAKNTYAREKLLGDLQTFDYGARRFDLIVCWDVLEHLEQPAAAVRRFADILAPGGHIIIKGPLPRTLKGLLTRFTPHALHVAFYRYFLGSKGAGLPGNPPFKAHLAFGSDPEDLGDLLTQHGLGVAAVEGFESMHVRAIADKSRLVHLGYQIAETAVARVLPRHVRGMTDFFLIAQRPVE